MFKRSKKGLYDPKNEKDSCCPKLLVMLNNKAIIKTKSRDPTVMPTAFRTTLSEICLLRITTSSCPRKVDLVAAIKAANVVVLIPPPVPPGQGEVM